MDVERKSEMRVPSLVARLMGLDSIPAAQREKSKKALCPDYSFSDGEECLSNHCELDRKGKDLEMRVVKHDSRPQKLQKTGVCERKAVTRFGAEALHIKSVLSRAKKHNHQHHPKLASPLKSPRITSGKSASRSSRLMGVAAKILEPGLQASRGKGTLTYHASACPLKGGIVKGGVGNAIMPNHSCYVSSASKTSVGQTSCKNCGNLLDVIDCKAEVRGPLDVPPPTVSAVITATSMVSSCKKGMPITPFHGQGRDIVLLRSQEKFASHVTDGEEENYAQQSWNEPTTIRIPMPREGPAQRSSNSSCRPIRAQEDDASSFAYKRKAQESKLSSESSSSGSTMCSMQVKRVSSCANTTSGTKDFVALNRSIIGQTRMRSPTKVDSSKFDLEKKPCNRQRLESLSHVRTLERKRTPNVTRLEGMTAANSVGLKQRNVRREATGGKRSDFNSSSLNSSNIKNKGQGEPVKASHNMSNDAASFTFSSPLKQKTVIHVEDEETNRNNERKAYFQRPAPLKVDNLGAFLEQKLKELTSQENELATTGVPQKSSAVILQELISALSSENLICHDGHVHNEDASFLVRILHHYHLSVPKFRIFSAFVIS